jgi:DNA topoisomerase-1
MRTLVISEKTDAAARLSAILSRGEMKRRSVSGVQTFEFEKDGGQYHVVGLRGHVIELDYPPEFNDWTAVDPKDLVYAKPAKTITAPAIISVLRELCEQADEVIIATDYDREGELIGLETVHMLPSGGKVIKRARFSAFTRVEIDTAFGGLVEPDQRLADSAECRQVVDLAWGAALTRFISLASGQVGSNFLSVGRVQSPTLALVVDRHKEIEAFVPSPYWTIGALLFKGQDFSADHAGNPFQEEAKAAAAEERAMQATKAKVLGYQVKEVDEYGPPPFNTTAFLAEANRIGLSPSNAMKIAEDLYTSGYISYPRTDNTVYPRSLNLRSVLEKLRESDLGKEADEILAQATIRPTRGRVEATDHPPIYPTEPATKKQLKGAKWEVYELITRRFFATVAPPGKGQVSNASLDLNGEGFVAKGYRSLNPGWKKYYPYLRITETELPALTPGEEVDVRKVGKERKETQPPRRYSQGTLLQEMEKLHLGTKSTRHDIVQKLYDRKYVNGPDLIPTLGGVAVISSLEKHAKVITESRMTAHLEEDMDAIADGSAALGDVVQESQDMLSDVLEDMAQHRQAIGDDIRGALHAQRHVGTCPACGGTLRTIRSKKGSEFIGCSNYPKCEKTYPKPHGALMESTDQTCPQCLLPMVRVVRRGTPPKVRCIDPNCESNREEDKVGSCPECAKDLRLIYSRAGKRFIGCSGYPDCKRTYPLPQFGKVFPTGDVCGECRAPLFGMSGKGSWTFCPNLDCPTSKLKDKKPPAKTAEGDAGKPVKKKPAKKAAVAKKAPAKKPSAKRKAGTPE